MSEENKDLDKARDLIKTVRHELEKENEKIIEYRNEMYRERDFSVGKFYTYNGPNYYLKSRALVFNVFIAPTGDSVEFFREKIAPFFPKLNEVETPYVVDLFAWTLLQVLRMDIDLYLNHYAVSKDEDEFVIAIEFFDKEVAIDAVYLVSDWFKALSDDKDFDFAREFAKMQADFDKTLFGGPTIYSLIEAGLKRGIPVFYLFEENQFQWGYGKKQLRGRSTTFNTDGIKDTEFTMYKDMVGDFLQMCGFPTPVGKNCFKEDECVEEALKLGFPVVVKPVAGHKGQGVTTNIQSEEEVRHAFQKIVKSAEEEGAAFEGALVQQQIYGTDHRLLAVGGKFVAALERVPAFVVGNGKDPIDKLIAEENDKLIRLDNARSPLCKIKVDDNLKEFLKLQNLSLSTVPQEGEKITLRRVANISAGGVSINVTDKIHRVNVKMVEDIASYFNVKCLGIDVLSADISKPWTEGNFGIIEINAGPGVFMHLAPAYGGSIDVPWEILKTHFVTPEYSRIPIIAGNMITQEFADMLNSRLHEIDTDIFFASLTREGVYFNGAYFFNNPEHDQNVKIVLRQPKADIALLSHDKDDIFDYGILHCGADIVILENAGYAEEKTMKEQLLPGGLLVEITERHMKITRGEELVTERVITEDEDIDTVILSSLDTELPELIRKYG